jgi:serine/threonine-protein kinase
VAPPPPAPPAPVAQEAPVELDREPAGAPSVASTAGTLEELHRLLSPAAAAVVPAAADVHRDSASADRPPGDDEWVADIAEGEDPAHERSRAPWWRDWRVGGVAAALLVVVAAGGTLGARRTPSRASVAPQSGTLEISSNPAGVETFVDGDLRGTTPLVLALDPGMHTVELRGAGDPRTIPITINAGMKVSQYVELSRGGARTAATKPASVAPVPDLVVAPPPSLPPAPAVPAAGWVTVKGASDVQVYEGGAALGSARDRLALSPGRHQLEFRNDELGIHSAAVVQISSGKVSSVDVAVPNGTLSLNALPWAEVWIDGEKAGETPLGNMTLPVGAHDIVFRHPELGERHQMVTVTRSETRRVSVDLNRP